MRCRATTAPRSALTARAYRAEAAQVLPGQAAAAGVHRHPGPGQPGAARARAGPLYGTSRTTVRQALAELVIEGRLLRMQGKGTFVAKPKVAQLLELASYTEGMRAHGLHPQTKILDIGYVTADEQLAALLGIRPGGRVLRIHRLRLADGEPMSIDTSHLPARRFPGLRRQLERHAVPVRDAADRLRHPAGRGRGDDRDRAGRPARRAAARRGPRPAVAAAVPARVRRHRRAGRVGQSWYRGDRYKFVTRLRRTPPSFL